MRDVDRIDTFTNHLGKLWRTYFPDWRFAQLMSNFYSFWGQDLFYKEEEEFMEKFEEFVYRNCSTPFPYDFWYLNEFIDKE